MKAKRLDFTKKAHEDTEGIADILGDPTFHQARKKHRTEISPIGNLTHMSSRTGGSSSVRSNMWPHICASKVPC
jgi:hypothetical protein